VEHLCEAEDLGADAARDLASALSVAGRYDAAVAVLDDALAAHGHADPGIEGQRFLHAAMAGEPLPPLDAEPAGRTRGERAYLAALCARALLTTHGRKRLGEWGTRLIEGCVAADLTSSGAIWHPAAYALTFGDEVALVERMVADGVAEAQRRGSALAAARAYQSRGMLRLRQGQLREAVADARLAIDASGDAGFAGRVVAIAVLVEALGETGELAEADAALSADGLQGELPLHFLANFLLSGRGRLRLAQGRTGDAIADFAELERRGKRWPPWNPAMFAYRSGLALAGDPRAQDLAREEVEVSRRWGAPRALGIALRVLGTVKGDRRLLEESAELLAGSYARLEHARSLVELGAVIRRAGRRSAAHEPLRAGMELGHRCGARPLVERARAELVLAGVRPRRAVRTGVDALTPAELRVARLAAEGMPNREIAQALYVTLRTVEVHLTHAYQKFGIASRQQLPAALRA
jgi:DNA-binding CsgD family transcriptional regulator